MLMNAVRRSACTWDLVHALADQRGRVVLGLLVRMLEDVTLKEAWR